MAIKDTQGPFIFTRRNLLKSAALAGAGAVVMRSAAFPQEAAPSSPAEELRIALIGAGSQGRVLMAACLNIPGIRFVAVCDVWEYSQKYAANVLKKYDQEVNVYVDYEDMLAKEKDLDAVLIATPDIFHEPHTTACLKAGLHVYCEKEMSNTIEGARGMVLAARESNGKLLQIGHQRRSNPRYKHANRMIHKEKIVGRITTMNGQWNRPVQEPLGWPEKYPIPADVLAKYGYDSMEQFRNWRWYKKYAGGPICDLGSHQIDIYNWFVQSNPTSVTAIGGINYYSDGRQWPDNVMTLYEYDGPEGKSQGFYQVINTSSFGGFYETFMGNEGTLVISEDVSKGFFVREVQATRREWEDEAELVEQMGTEAVTLQIGASREARGEASAETLAWEEDANKPEHQPHLENFFRAIRTGEELACPGEEAFATAVTVLTVNQAIAEERKIHFKPEDFKV